MSNPNVWLSVDVPDPDNKMLLIAATKSSGFNVVGASVTGRPVFQETADGIVYDSEASKKVRTFGAMMMAGMLQRLGCDVPVFEGSIAAHDPIPFNQHMDERDLDDVDVDQQNYHVKGGLAEAAELIDRTSGPMHFICGGPMSDIAYFLDYKDIKRKFGWMTAQLGFMGWNPDVQTFTGGKSQFNIMCDPAAAKKVAQEYPGPFGLVPTDITKSEAFSFSSRKYFIDTLTRNAGLEEEVYQRLLKGSGRKGVEEVERAYERYHLARSHEHTTPHDIHPVILMRHLLALIPRMKPETDNFGEWIGPYRATPIVIKDVPDGRDQKDRWGEIDVRIRPSVPGEPIRFAVTAAKVEAVIANMRWLLTSLPGYPDHRPSCPTVFKFNDEILRQSVEV